MRLRISTNITWARYIFAAITIVFLYDIFHYITLHLTINHRVMIESSAAVLFATLFYYFDQRKNVEYDYDSLYILWKNKETKIPLSDIRKVKLTLTKINNKDTWKIDYNDANGVRQNVRLIPNKHNPEAFESFKRHIIDINPKATIENEAKVF